MLSHRLSHGQSVGHSVGQSVNCNRLVFVLGTETDYVLLMLCCKGGRGFRCFCSRRRCCCCLLLLLQQVLCKVKLSTHISQQRLRLHCPVLSIPR